MAEKPEKQEKEQLIIESLSPIERKLLPLLSKESQKTEHLEKKAEMDKTSVLRALEFLKTKELVETESNEKKLVDLGVNGILYSRKGLPERRVLHELSEKRSLALTDLEKLGLSEDEAKVVLGVLKKKALIKIVNGHLMLDAKKEEITKKMFEELLLEKLPKPLESLEDEEKFALVNLQKRKDIIELKTEKEISGKLTSLGEKIAGMNLKSDMLEQLTPKILASESLWKGKKFRRYDLSSGSRIYAGKRYFVNQATDYARKLWTELGFKEMSGNMTQTSFWNFDVLFTAQDHSAREMQDTFFIKGMEGKLPDKKFVQAVKQAHEKGWDGSKGWQYQWEEKDAKKILLRTHTTCLSGQTLKKIAETKEFPAKYFALGKCFRNETVDWGHGFEFNQTEGIVVDENANFKQLLGYLREFFKKMGYEKIRIRPGYFPYTEPSLEIDVWHPVRQKWFELGGAGMFRPELTIPIFGKHIPVLAWGPGFDRIIMEYFQIADFREMYKNDLTKLRDIKFWGK